MAFSIFAAGAAWCLASPTSSQSPTAARRRYLAAELDPREIRVHAISPGPVRTRAASGIDRFDELMARRGTGAATAACRYRGRGRACRLSGQRRRTAITGTVIPVDGGQHVLA